MPAVNEVAPIYADEQNEDDLFLPRDRPKKDTRSKLMRSKERAAGLVVNACPFGCQDHELDEQAYCRHLIGFTDPNDKRIYYPVVWRETRDSRGNPVKRYRYVNGEDPQLVQPGDHCERISLCYRVYREDPGEQPVVGPPVGKLDKPQTTAAAPVTAPDLTKLLEWAKRNGYEAQTQTTGDGHASGTV